MNNHKIASQIKQIFTKALIILPISINAFGSGGQDEAQKALQPLSRTAFVSFLERPHEVEAPQYSQRMIVSNAESMDRRMEDLEHKMMQTKMAQQKSLLNEDELDRHHQALLNAQKSLSTTEQVLSTLEVMAVQFQQAVTSFGESAGHL